ncbi:MAG TPA: hypothetical protein VFP50_10065 [Anaeromyxobacteraceae bacterium]|nr:hypothetical protein [Anaeromyxobacteraceae bacterium]
MRALALVALTLGALPAAAATPLALAERQVVTLEFARPVARLATTDPDLLALEPAGARLRVAALRGGRAQVDVIFDDGASVTYDVSVAPARRPEGAGAAPGELALAVGEERRIPAPGLARLLLEENGVARVRADGGAVVVTGLAAGRSSAVLVDGAGARTTLSIRVRP